MTTALAWLRRELARTLPGGDDDADAFLDGRELPSQTRRKKDQLAGLAGMGGRIVN